MISSPRKLGCRLSERFQAMDLLYISSDIQNIIEIVKNRLYFAIISSDKEIRSTEDTFFFRVDKDYLYMNYYNDFGPLNLSCIYKYCNRLNDYMTRTDYARIVHYTPNDLHKKTNAAFLMGCYAILFYNVSPKETYKALITGNTYYKPFVDASQGTSQWTISLIDCFSAIYKAQQLGFFNFSDFNVTEYDQYDKLQNGDLNWLLPRKFLAFIGPTDLEITNYHSPEFYVQYFMANDVRTVIRLNNVTYDPAVFTSMGINHYDLFFPDGSTPPKHILLKFLDVAETTSGALAVHCKAGLGRTGSLIGAYVIKHHHFTAKEAIAWLRICRPGSVIGQQQGWLERIEGWLWRQGSAFRLQTYSDCERIPHYKYGIYSVQWKKERDRMMKIARRKEIHGCSAHGVRRSLRKQPVRETSDFFQQKPSTEIAALFRHPSMPPNNLCDKNNMVKHNLIVNEKEGTQGDKLNNIKVCKQPTANRLSAQIPQITNKFKTKYTFGHPTKQDDRR